MEVEYGSDNPLSLGANVINLTVLQSKPTVKYSKAGNKQYELVMVDYDKMKIGDEQDWKLWHIKNIPGDDLKNGQLDEGTVETEYKSVTQENPRNLLHHYLFLIYEMKEGDENENVGDRMLGCCPVAGNFFSTKKTVLETIENRQNEIQDYIDNQNMTEDQKDGLRDLIPEFDKLKDNLNDLNRRNEACAKWQKILEKLEEILDKIAAINVGSNKDLRKFLQSLKDYVGTLKKTYQKEFKDNGCDNDTETTTVATTTEEVTSTSPGEVTPTTTSTTTSTTTRTMVTTTTTTETKLTACN